MKIFIDAVIDDSHNSDFLKKEIEFEGSSFEDFLNAVSKEKPQWRESLTCDPYKKTGFISLGFIGMSETHWEQFLKYGNVSKCVTLKPFQNYIKLKKV